MPDDFDVEYTDQFGKWWDDLNEVEQFAINERVKLLATHGPNLKRPVVGTLSGSKFDPQMKEIRCEVGGRSIRVLFIFDQRRTAILLLGGDKTGRWNEWYVKAIPEADQLYEIHLVEVEAEMKKDTGETSHG